mgnify:CR=1 FL=1
MKYLISQSIDALFLPVRYSNTLKRHGVMTLGDFLRIENTVILDFKGVRFEQREYLIRIKDLLAKGLTADGMIDAELPTIMPVPSVPPKTPAAPRTVEEVPIITVPPENDFPIEELNMTVRANNVLWRKNLTLFSQIVNFTLNDLLDFRGVGHATAEEIFDAVQQARSQYLSGENHAAETPKTSAAPRIRRKLSMITVPPENDFPIEELNMTVWANHVLRRKNLVLFSQVVNLTLNDLLNFRGIGHSTAEEIFDAVQQARSPFLSGEPLPTAESESDAPTLHSLTMSNRAHNTLKRLGISTTDQFLAMTESDIRSMKGCGKETAQELIYLSKKMAGCTTVLSPAEKQFLQVIADAVDIWPHTLMLSAEAVKKQNRGISLDSLLENIFSEPEYFSALKNCVMNRIKQVSNGMGISSLFEAKLYPFADSIAALNAVQALEEEGKISVDKDFITYIAPSLADVLTARPDCTEKQHFMQKLQGRTLQEIADGYQLTRERVRQKIKKYISSLPVVSEDKYAYLFTVYDISKEDFTRYIDKDPTVVEYLRIRYNRNNELLPLSQGLGDEKIPMHMRKQMERALYKNHITVDGVLLQKNRASFVPFTVRRYAQDAIAVSDYFDRYNEFVTKLGLQNDSGVTIESTGSYINRLASARYVLWSNRQHFRYYDMDGLDFTDFLQELDLTQYKDVEITTLKIWREHPDLMRQYDIRDEYELHNLLRKILSPEQIREWQIEFSKMPTIIFGKADRDMQVLEQLMLYAPISAEELGQRYEEAYGVKAATAIGTYFKSISTYYHEGVYRIDSKDLTYEQYQQMRSLMVEDFYLIDDVKRIYRRIYPEAPASDISPYTLKVLGFNVYTNYIIRDTFSSARNYYQTTYFSQDIFDAGSMRSEVFNSPTFSVELHKCLNDRELTAYEPKKYINIRRLEQIGITKTTLEDYCNQVYKFALEKDVDFFTITTLHKLGFSHELDDAGFDDYFYASVLMVDRRHFDYCRMSRQCCFFLAGTHSSVTRSTLIESVVQREEKMEIEDLILYLEKNYGIHTDRDDVKQYISNTSLYYDAIMQTAYKNYDLYLEEF